MVITIILRKMCIFFVHSNNNEVFKWSGRLSLLPVDGWHRGVSHMPMRVNTQNRAKFTKYKQFHMTDAYKEARMEMIDILVWIMIHFSLLLLFRSDNGSGYNNTNNKQTNEKCEEKTNARTEHVCDVYIIVYLYLYVNKINQGQIRVCWLFASSKLQFICSRFLFYRYRALFR